MALNLRTAALQQFELSGVKGVKTFLFSKLFLHRRLSLSKGDLLENFDHSLFGSHFAKVV